LTRSSAPQSAALRGALWITLIALLATGAALTVQYLQTTRLVEARMRALVDDEMTSLVARYEDYGLIGVEAAIERQRSLPRLNEFFYLLAAPDGRPIAGNLLGWPAAVDAPGFHSFAVDAVNTRGRPTQRQVDARAVTLGGGYRLLVGNFADERAALRDTWLRSLFWSLLATGALGLALGWWYSRRGLGFVDTVSDAGQRFLAGSLDERLPVSPRGDEYDRLALTFNRVFAEVERLVTSLRATTDGMAHDLKTPLTRIRARLELAEMSGDTVPAEAIAASRRDLDSLLELIDGALALARAESTGAAAFAPIDLDAIVGEAIDLYRPLAEEAGLILVADLQPAKLNGARSLLAQAATNLIDNAIKFTPKGGTIRVSTGMAAGRVQLTVSDTGPGIPAAERDTALARFHRLERDTGTPGNGLGLSLVAVVARIHGAALTLDDAASGLCVMLRFPA
jgi:signal transduction histidine kinase